MRIWVFCLFGLLFFASQVAGRGEYRLGGADGNSWQDALSTEAAGTYLIFDAVGQEVRRVPVAVSPHGAGTDTLIDFLNESDAYVRKSAIEVLSELSPKEGAKHIAPLLSDKNVHVSNAAEKALAKMGLLQAYRNQNK